VCTVEDQDLRRRFYREAEIAGRMQHKNIVTVFAFGTEGDQPYLVQELLDGEDLEAVIRRRDPLTPARKLAILEQVALALDYAHRQGVVHRDVKPGNVRLLANGRVKLMDFGIAKLAGVQTQLTREGVTLGTASYLPPEQVRAEPLDHRADIFSFGVLSYELMSYERPFRGNTLSALVYQILYKVPLPLTTAWEGCPPSLSALVARCLAKKPSERWASIGEILPQLEQVRTALESMDAASPEASASAARHLLEDTRPVTMVEDTPEPVAEDVPEPVAEDVPEPEVKRPAAPRASAASPAETLENRPRVDLDAPTLPFEDAEATAAVARFDGGQEAGDTAAPLARRAEEIGGLIAKGELQSAMEQLEETVHKHRDATGEEPATALQPPPPPRPSPHQAAAAASQPAALLAAASRMVARVLDRLPRRHSLPRRYLLPGAIVAGVVALVLVFALWRGRRSEPTPVPAAPSVVPASTEPVIADPTPATGIARLAAAPWAEVLEIVDAGGHRQPLPAEPFTPLLLQLPGGRFRVTLRYPEGAEPVTCELDIVAGAVADCAPAAADTDAIAYFKAAGWWR